MGRRNKKASLWLVLGLVILAWCVFLVLRRGGGDGLNVVLVVLDTARADRFSCHGYDRVTSPNIDGLAKEGVAYNQAYTTDFWTLPAHGSLLTGLYPSQTGATSETNQFPEMNLTLAEILRGAGYETAAFICNSWVSKERGFGQGFGEYQELWRQEARGGDTMAGAAERAATSQAVDWLAGRRPGGKPFFLFMNLNCAHLPYRPPEPFLLRFLRYGYKAADVQRVSGITGMWAHLAGALKLTEQDYRIMSDLYDGEVAFADDCVGQIIDSLREGGVLDETLVIVTSDHGENIGEHGMIDHLLSMYDTTLRIPLVVRYPERFAGGGVSEDLVSLVDVMPTILDVCGLAEKAGHLEVASTSLCSESRSQRAFIVAENERPVNGMQLLKAQFPGFDTTTIDYRMRALRTKGQKLIWKIGGQMEVYDLARDAGEVTDLAATDALLRDRMHVMLKNWMSRIPAAEDISLFQSTDEESLEALRSLGYIE